MEKVFEMHTHYTFEIPLAETVDIFREEFLATGSEKYTFLSLPHHATPEGELLCAPGQNVKGLFLKKVFSPHAYAFAGLQHPLDVAHRDDAELADSYLAQAELYRRVGFDGIKMLEGYPSMRKAMRRRLDDPVYDPFYSFLEENRLPVTMHIANPATNWDIASADEYAILAGRVCDGSFPSKEQLHREVDGIMEKHPRLRMILAHFGFLSYDIEAARRWLRDYENTLFDITPGGEQLLNMRSDWDAWHAFFCEYGDRILYGSDFYAFPRSPAFTEDYWRRPRFLRQFFETDGEHIYGERHFCGVKLEKSLRDKIYYKNAVREMGTPRAIDESWLREEAERLLSEGEAESLLCADMAYILKSL